MASPGAAGSSSEEEDNAPIAAWRPPDLAQLQQQADDDDSDDEEGQPPAAESAATGEAVGAEEEWGEEAWAGEEEWAEEEWAEPAEEVVDGASAAGASDEAGGSGSGTSLLPSALDALDDEGLYVHQGFLHQKYTPEFDASKRFKPPPMTAADLGPAYGTERTH